MPYTTKKVGGKWLLAKTHGGRVVGTHRSKAAAQAQRRAIYASKARKRKGVK